MKWLLTISFVAIGAISAQAQECPSGFVCITQEVANKAASVAKELAAAKEQIAARDEAIKARDLSIKEIQEQRDKSVADLTTRLHSTELKLAETTGTLIGVEKQNVEQRAIIQALLPMVKKKRNAFITIF
jgi:septal ring factor EnvC (AmiA/AmiB activator)